MTLALCVGAPLVGAAAIALGGGRLAGRAAVAVAFTSLAVAFGAALVMTQAFVDGRASVIAEIGRWLPVRGSALALVATPSSIAPLMLASLLPAGLLAVAARRRTAAELRSMALAAALSSAALALIASATDLLLVVVGWHVVGLTPTLLSGRSAVEVGARRVGDIALLLAVAAYLALFNTSDVGEIVRRVDPSLPADALGRLATSLAVSSGLVAVALVGMLAPPLRMAVGSGRRVSFAASLPRVALALAATALLLIRIGPLVHPAAFVFAGMTLVVAVIARLDVAGAGRAGFAVSGALEAGIERALERAGALMTNTVRGVSTLVRLEGRSHRVREAVALAVAVATLAFWSLR